MLYNYTHRPVSCTYKIIIYYKISVASFLYLELRFYDMITYYTCVNELYIVFLVVL